MTLCFIAIAVSLIVGAILDHYFFHDEEALIEKGKELAYTEIDKAKAIGRKI